MTSDWKHNGAWRILLLFTPNLTNRWNTELFGTIILVIVEWLRFFTKVENGQNDVKKLIYKLSEVELIIKKNINISINLITNFILEQSSSNTNN